HPQGIGAGTQCDAFVQAHDIAPTVLEAAGITPPEPMDGRSFWKTAFEGGEPIRRHVTVGWGGSLTVIDDQWWFNCKVDGTGALLYPVRRGLSDASVAHEQPERVREFFRTGKADAGGTFPDYLLKRTAALADHPGSAPFNADA
ncbi:MAG: hypothetical protein KJ023_03345, partial [Burkholderiaceae bacterium]|nr:hypothetical protein [Burkholderiaceae bacterium]